MNSPELQLIESYHFVINFEKGGWGLPFILNSAPTCLQVYLHFNCFRNHSENSEKEKKCFKKYSTFGESNFYIYTMGRGASPWLQQELWRAREKGSEILTQVHLFYRQEIFSLEDEQLSRLLQANSKLHYLIFPSNEMNFNIFN